MLIGKVRESILRDFFPPLNTALQSDARPQGHKLQNIDREESIWRTIDLLIYNDITIGLEYLQHILKSMATFSSDEDNALFVIDRIRSSDDSSYFLFTEKLKYSIVLLHEYKSHAAFECIVAAHFQKGNGVKKWFSKSVCCPDKSVVASQQAFIVWIIVALKCNPWSQWHLMFKPLKQFMVIDVWLLKAA